MFRVLAIVSHNYYSAPRVVYGFINIFVLRRAEMRSAWHIRRPMQIAQLAHDLGLLSQRQLDEVWGSFRSRNVPLEEFLQRLKVGSC